MNGDTSQLHWFAGFMESRGCIGIGIDVDTNSRKSAIRLEGSSQDRDILRRVQSICGGTIQKRPSDARGGHAVTPDQSRRYGYRNNGYRRQLFRWRCSGERAATILREIAPLLASRSRQRVAMAAIQHFEEHKSRKKQRKESV